MNNNFQKLFSVNAWWLHAASHIHGKVLAIGYFNQDTISYMQTLCSKLCHIENTYQPLQNNNSYDAIVINNHPKILGDKQIIGIVSHNLTTHGLAVIYETNSGHVSNLLTTPLSVIKSLSKKYQSQRFSCINCKLFTIHYPTVSYSGKAYESVHNGLYSSNKNTFLAKEKFKAHLYKTNLIHILATTNILLLRKRTSSKSLLDNVSSTLAQTLELPEKSKLYCSNILYNRGKLIFTYPEMKEKHKGYIIVLALSLKAIRQRNNEKLAIEQMSKSQYFSKLVCNKIHHTNIFGLDCYIMPRMAGITVDIDSPYLKKMTTAAYHIIKKLSSEFEGNNDSYELLKGKLAEYCDKTSERLPFLRTLISELKNNLRNSPYLTDLKTVRLHGDLKLENLMLNESHEVIGLIDWELYEPKSFPLLDLLYLIFYNIQVRNGGDFIDAFYQFTDNLIPEYEKEILTDYTQYLSLSEEQIDFLLTIFIVHHFGCRMNIDTNNSTQTARTKAFFVDISSRVSIPKHEE